MAGEVYYLGLALKNPIIAAAGPWSGNAERIQRSIDAGAAAVVTETVSLEGSCELCPRIYSRHDTILNTTLYSPVSFEAWEDELVKINKKDSYIICNIRGNTPSEFAYISACMERWGADALELTPFTPTGAQLEAIDSSPEAIYEIIKAVVRTVDIPVSVRLPFYLSGQKKYIRKIEEAGASGIATTETMKALWGVDLERKCSLVPTFGGLSGPALLPITFAAVAGLSQMTACSIAAMGGVTAAEEALECVMLGADAVQVGSSILLSDYKVIGEMVSEIEKWLYQHQYKTLSSIHGAALKTIHAYEDLHFCKRKGYIKEHVAVLRETVEKSMKACLNGAISYSNDKLSINEERCNGCGVCMMLASELFGMKKVK